MATQRRAMFTLQAAERHTRQHGGGTACLSTGELIGTRFHQDGMASHSSAFIAMAIRLHRSGHGGEGLPG